MGWFFKRGAEKKDLQDLVESMKVSFSNVKKDISKIKDSTDQNQDEIQELHNVIGYLNQSLRSLNEKVDSIKFQPARQNRTREISEELEEFPQESPQTISQPRRIEEKLTTVQDDMLKKLAALSRESGGSPISAKELTTEMYPESEYSSIRPMISNYLDLLEELNLLKKMRKRRQVFIELTEKGKSLASSPITNIKISRSRKKD